tara:strand:+ start:31 stop:246 length:216 start_codon:yes stop_codon:yes gene_type:complete
MSTVTVEVINNFDKYSYYNNSNNTNNSKLLIENNYLKNIKKYQDIDYEIELINNKYNEENYKNNLNKIIFG